MRRSRGNEYYALPNQSASENLLESENEVMTDELKDKIHALKSLSIDIGMEVKYQDKIIRDLDDDFEHTGGFLGSTLSRVLRLGKGGHNYYILYMILFSLFVFAVLWFVIKFR
ncbi:hypothetical protein PR048_019499 [Dryococelus australis]|uniref:t-SNARE coiled-coil homology domain-containing protein n=1 Tax=Dryococelus australis TaxID=614101 RepID=A0ABQ9H3M3_9NEOP|nr:hypothetical protein PR048_019499 [Dryococelus australis]